MIKGPAKIITERRYPDIKQAVQALAEGLTRELNKAISVRGHALMAVSGGRTPKTVFPVLRQQTVDWRRVTITLTDERWVTADHPDSNERLARDFLLQGPVQTAAFVPLFGGENSPNEGQAACEDRLGALPLPLDAVYLGLGADGHFASLFPGDKAIDVQDSLCVAVPGTRDRMPRISLTAKVILEARSIFLLFAGEAKYKIYMAAKAAGAYHDLPLRLLLHQKHTTVSVLYSS